MAFEDRACEYLKRIGYDIVLRNYKPTKYSEVDIIAVDHGCFVGVEVKGLTRKADAVFGADFIRAMISKRKIFKITSALNLYLQSSGDVNAQARIDVVFSPGGDLFHYKNVSTQ